MNISFNWFTTERHSCGFMELFMFAVPLPVPLVSRELSFWILNIWVYSDAAITVFIRTSLVAYIYVVLCINLFCYNTRVMLFFSVQGWSLSWKLNVVASNFNYSQLHNHPMGLCWICRKWACTTDWLYVRVVHRKEWKWEVKTLMETVQFVNEIHTFAFPCQCIWL